MRRMNVQKSPNDYEEFAEWMCRNRRMTGQKSPNECASTSETVEELARSRFGGPSASAIFSAEFAESRSIASLEDRRASVSHSGSPSSAALDAP